MAALPVAIDRRRGAPAADRLPTLTEVVELGQLASPAVEVTERLLPAATSAAAVVHASVPDSLPAPMRDMRDVRDIRDIRDELSTSVLAELQPRIELLLESRLREALAPALARVADGLIRDTRDQLAATLQALVQEAVSQALERRRPD